MRELIVRCAGAAVLLSASVGWGLFEIREGRRRLRELEAVLALVRRIREQIERFGTPLCEIYSACDDPELARTGFLALLRTKGMEAAADGADLRLSEGERGILRELGGRLGRGFREEQTALCRYAEDGLSEAFEKLRTDTAGRERLWRALPPLAALSLILMLY